MTTNSASEPQGVVGQPADAYTMRMEIERLRATVDFVALWAWNKDGLTVEEKFGAIQWHPTIRAAAGLGPFAEVTPAEPLKDSPHD